MPKRSSTPSTDEVTSAFDTLQRVISLTEGAEERLVSGLVSFNARGKAVSVAADTLTPYPDEATLPTIEQLSGLFKKPARESFTIREYMEYLREGR